MRLNLLFIFLGISCGYVMSQTDTTISSFDRKTYFLGRMIDGSPFGIWKEFDSLGTLVKTIEIIDNKGYCKIEPSFGNTGLEGYYHGYFKQNRIILHGPYQITNNSLRTRTEGKYWYDKMDGQKRYFKNEELKTLDYYYKDSTNYISIPFNETGEIISVYGLNREGINSGVFVDFDDSIHVSAVGNFADGCKVGEWSYFKYGRLICKGNYYPDYLHLKSINDQNDTLYLVNKSDSLASIVYPEEVINSFNVNEQILYIKDGKWYYFDIDGNLIKTECFDKGQLVLDKKEKRKIR